MHCKHNYHTSAGLHWFCAIAAALALSSCAASVGGEDAPDGGVPVSFSALTGWNEADGGDKADGTRLADGTDGLAFENGDAIGVFAYKNDSSTPDFMNNQKVTYDGMAWSYSPTKYWPQNDDILSFYATSPYNAITGGDITVTSTDGGHPTVNYDNTRADVDWTVAKREAVTCAAGKNGVALDFKHLTARVKFKFAIEGNPSYHPVVHVLKYNIPHYRGAVDYTCDENDAFVCSQTCDGDSVQITRYVNNVDGEIVRSDGITIPEFTAYLPPCSFPCTDKPEELGEFIISLNNIEHRCKPKDLIKVEGGKSYTVKFNIKQTDSGSGSTNFFITSYSLWEDGGSYEGNLN